MSNNASNSASYHDSDEAIREQAATLVVQVDGASTDAEKQGLLQMCREWRAQSAQHEKIFNEMQQLWQIATQSAGPTSNRSKTSSGKRTAAGGVLLGFGLLVWFNLQMFEVWMADTHTARGEIRQVSLSDGSRITLNSDSAVNIRFDGNMRKVELVKGELLAEVAHEPHFRPFVVESRDGAARALGTRYLVKQEADFTTATVIESTVAVSAKQTPDMRANVSAGNSLRYNEYRLFSPTPAPISADSWVHARLVFQDTPLDEVISALSHYRRGVIYVRISHTEKLRFTGTLPTDDTEQALNMLEQALPVKVNKFSNYLTWVELK